MVTHLFARFLDDPEQYAGSERCWVDLWERIDPTIRTRFQWSHPWVGTGSPAIRDGNPIFSAVSPVLRRGVRIIQHEPSGPDLELNAWPDTFGGEPSDPESINELVISCALSDVASEVALSLMIPWAKGESPSFKDDESGHLIPDEEAPLPG